MEAAMNLNTYTQEKTIRERIEEALKELKMNKAELALRINYSRPAISQYLNNKYNSDPSQLEEKLLGFLAVYDEMRQGNLEKGTASPTAGIRPKIEYFESTDYIQTIGICKACQENKALGRDLGFNH